MLPDMSFSTGPHMLAKTLVDQLQSDRAHANYHMIQRLQTDIDVGEGELLHAPVWFARYEHKGGKIVVVLDGNSDQETRRAHAGDGVDRGDVTARPAYFVPPSSN